MKELVAIIKACGENGVTFFKQGDIEIRFGNHVEEKPMAVHPQFLRPIEIDAKFEQEEKDLTRQDVMENLVVEDPELYEEMLAQGRWDAESKQ